MFFFFFFDKTTKIYRGFQKRHGCRSKLILVHDATSGLVN